MAALIFLVGCGSNAVDYPLAAGHSNQEQALIDSNPAHNFIVMTFSGGGSRAAYLGAAVVERLNHLRYISNGETRTLAEDIAVVSSVSGGSVYAADLGLNGPSHATDFKQRIQSFDGIRWLVDRALNPLTWISLQIENKTRVDVLQEMIGELLQTSATLSAFDRPDRPLILLNATDMVAGQVFTFDRASIDDLCMDYDRIPVTLGVTASAAFPIAFTPILLRNDSYAANRCLGRRNPNLPYQVPLQVEGGPYDNLETFRTSRYRQSLRNETVHAMDAGYDIPPFRTPEYLRLVDGGVADNSGLTALRRALLVPGGAADLGRLISQGKLRRLIVIAVNARSDPKSDLDTSDRYTTALTMADAISGSLVDNASSNSASVFKSFIETLIDDRDRLIRQGQRQAQFAIYPIAIDLDQLPGMTETERQEQQMVKSIGTSWTLKPRQFDALDHAAGELLWRHPCFRTLVTDIDLQGNPETTPVAGTRCPVRPPQIASPLHRHPPT